MKHLKLDLMTVLFVVVVIGVVATMSTQASDRSLDGSEALQTSALSASAALPARL
jgi:hypothetical protein